MYFSSRRDSTIVAWHEVAGKRPSKEPSRRVRYERAQLIPRSSSSKSATRMTIPIVAWHEIPDDLRLDGTFPKNLQFVCSHLRNSVAPETSIIESKCGTSARIRPYPTGRLFGVGMSQALRARLRSCCPSGRKATQQSGAPR